MKWIYISCLFLFYRIGYSQNITIYGYILDYDTGESIPNTSVYNETSNTYTLSNDYGFYSLEIRKKDNMTTIDIAHLGYKPVKDSIRSDKNLQKNYYLKSENLLEEVVIMGRKEKPIEKRLEISTINPSIEEVNKIPSLGGETDIIKSLQLMPGVQSGNEGSSQLYVRGGSPDQNLILLDDVPLYYVNHLGGFVSIFNTDALKNIKLIKGGFPARYGNRLSSIVDIKMKDGNNQKFQGNAMIGLISSKISIEGPLIKNKSSYIISVRRMLYDLIVRPVTYFIFDKKASLGYHFYDVNIKTNYFLSDNDKLIASIYMGNDKLGFTSFLNNGKEQNNNKWGNRLVSLRWNHIFNSHLFSNTNISYTHYKLIRENIYKESNHNKQASYTFKSAISDFGLKTDFNYYYNPNYSLNFGADFTFHKYQPSITKLKQYTTNQPKDTIYGVTKLNSLETSAYIENIFKIGNFMDANLGIRYNSYFVKNKALQSIEPRLLARITLSKKTSLKASFSKMNQNIHLLSTTGMGIPMDLWLPVTDRIPQEKSQQLTLGLARSIFNNKIELSLETYYKKMKNLIAYKEGVSYLGTSNWEDKIETNGKGTSFGVEFLAHKKRGKTTGWISYTWAKTNRQFHNIAQGQAYPFTYDRRHSLNLVLNYKIKDNIDFSGTWVYGSGNPYTLAIGKYQGIDNNDVLNSEENIIHTFDEIYIYDGRNNQRMRDYHRIDIGFNFHKNKKRGERIWNISIYNLYNRKNPYFYFFDQETENGQLTLKQQSLFPVIPSVSYSFKF